MQFLKSIFVFLCCSALIGGNAYRTGRFDDTHAVREQMLSRACERVDLLPRNIGEWVGVDRQVTDEQMMRRGGAVKYVSRTYKLTGSNEAAVVLLLCGKAGPLSVHTPDICTTGANFSADPNQRTWDGIADSELTWQSFTSQVDGQPNLEIAVAWTADGRWRSPTSPRMTFGREPFLFKLYVIRPCLHESKPSAFMEDLLRGLVPAALDTVFDSAALEEINLLQVGDRDSGKRTGTVDRKKVDSANQS